MNQMLTMGIALLLGMHQPQSQKASPNAVVLKDPAHSASLIFEKSTENGSIVETETWSIGKTSRIVKSTFSESGTLLQRMVAVTRGLSTQRTDATVSPHGASVTSAARNGTGPTSTIALNSRESIVDPSVLWFSSDQPKVGATIAFMSFDPEFRYWEEVSVTFDGRGKLAGSDGNLVTRKAARSTVHMLLDDKGMPIVWEEGRFSLVRAPH